MGGNYAKETGILRRVVANPKCEWIWTKHALERMAERKISAADVIRVLTFGQITLHEVKQDILWRVEGTDADGQKLAVIASVLEEMVLIKVVTTF